MSIVVFPIALIVGVGFLIASLFVGNSLFTTCWEGIRLVAVGLCPSGALGKEVGFIWALNWSVGLVLLLPALAYCIVEGVVRGEATIKDLVDRGMVITADWVAAPQDRIDLMRRWRLLCLRVWIPLVALVVLFANIWSFQDVVARFYSDSGLPSIPSVSRTDPALEVDWSIAAPATIAFQGGEPDCDGPLFCATNWWFDIATHAFLPWLTPVLILSFAGYILLHFVQFRMAGLVVIPETKTTDPRRGLDVFREIILWSAGVCLVAFSMGYLISLQNVYLRDTNTNILGTLFSIFQPANPVLNVEVLGAVIVGGLLLLLIVLGPIGLALRAKRKVLDDLRSPLLADAAATYLGLENETQRTNTMAVLERRFLVWPLYARETVYLLIFLALLLASVFFVQIGPVLVVLAGAGIGAITYSGVRAKTAPPPKPLDQKVRVVFFAANPLGTPRVDLEREQHDVVQEVQRGRLRDQIAFEDQVAVQPQDMITAMDDFDPAVVHFSGHGDESGIYVRGEGDEIVPISADALAALLNAHKVKLVVLNSCYSQEQADVIMPTVKAVVGTTYAVRDKAAIRFSVAFYRAISDGRTLGQAYERGRLATRLQGGTATDVFKLVGDRDLVLIVPVAAVPPVDR